MADDKSYLEQSLSWSETLNGQEATPAEMATELAKYSPQDRAGRIEALKADLEVEHLTIGQAAKLHNYHRAMSETHALLRKAGR